MSSLLHLEYIGRRRREGAGEGDGGRGAVGLQRGGDTPNLRDDVGHLGGRGRGLVVLVHVAVEVAPPLLVFVPHDGGVLVVGQDHLVGGPQRELGEYPAEPAAALLPVALGWVVFLFFFLFFRFRYRRVRVPLGRLGGGLVVLLVGVGGSRHPDAGPLVSRLPHTRTSLTHRRRVT